MILCGDYRDGGCTHSRNALGEIRPVTERPAYCISRCDHWLPRKEEARNPAQPLLYLEKELSAEGLAKNPSVRGKQRLYTSSCSHRPPRKENARNGRGQVLHSKTTPVALTPWTKSGPRANGRTLTHLVWIACDCVNRRVYARYCSHLPSGWIGTRRRNSKKKVWWDTSHLY